jgi:glycerol kinase
MNLKLEIQAKSESGTLFTWRGTVETSGNDVWAALVRDCSDVMKDNVRDAKVRRIVITLPKR